jgi:hypothetical protein
VRDLDELPWVAPGSISKTIPPIPSANLTYADTRLTLHVTRAAFGALYQLHVVDDQANAASAALPSSCRHRVRPGDPQSMSSREADHPE